MATPKRALSARICLSLLGGFALVASLWQPASQALPNSLDASVTLAGCEALAERDPPGNGHEPRSLFCQRPRRGHRAQARASVDGISPSARLLVGASLPINCCPAEALGWLPQVTRRAAAGLVAERERGGPYRDGPDLRRAAFVGAKVAAALDRAVDYRWPCTPLAAELTGSTGKPGKLSEPDEPGKLGELGELSESVEPSKLGELSEPGEASELSESVDPGKPGLPWHAAVASAKPDGVRPAWLVHVIRFLPARSISRAWGWLVRVRRPAVFATWLKTQFVASTGIDMAEAKEPIESYGCLEDLFVRELKPGARPIDPDPQILISPTDSQVGASGTVENGTLLQIKGQSYSLAELLGDAGRARQFEGGAYITLYLSPRDYHRIHAPASGHVTAAQLLPGRLLPVFPAALTKEPALLARNERIVTYLRSIDASELAVVAVGATLVGRIGVTYDPSLRANERNPVARTVKYAKPPWLARGEQLGAFELGSTVVVLCQRDRVVLDAMAPGTFVRVGQRLGRAKRPQRGRDDGAGPALVHGSTEES